MDDEDPIDHLHRELAAERRRVTELEEEVESLREVRREEQAAFEERLSDLEATLEELETHVYASP